MSLTSLTKLLLPPARFLMVDDDPAFLASLRAGLGPRHDVRAVGTGAAAVAALGRHSVDLVFLADRLPDGPGVPVLRQIKERYPQVLVFLMTAAGSEELVIACYENGGRAYLRKPFDLARIRLFIEKLLMARRMNRERRIPIFWDPALPLTAGRLRPNREERTPVLLGQIVPPIASPLGPGAGSSPQPAWIGDTLPFVDSEANNGHRRRRPSTGRGAARRRARPPLRRRRPSP